MSYIVYQQRMSINYISAISDRFACISTQYYNTLYNVAQVENVNILLLFTILITNTARLFVQVAHISVD